MNQIHLSIGEASVNLYPSNADGEALLDAPVWAGAAVHGLRVSKSYNVHKFTPTGDDRPIKRHEGQTFEISINRGWFIRVSTLAEFDPQANERWVMVVVWQDQRTGYWHRRTYYGVSCDGWEASTNGMVESIIDQRFEAEEEKRESGRTAYSTTALPSTATGDEIDEAYPFFMDDAIAQDEYLMGQYSWTKAVEISSISLICNSPQTTETRFKLEVDGELVNDVYTIVPQDVEGAISDGTATFSYQVPANAVCRWKCIVAPESADDQATNVSLVMKVKLV